MPKFWHIFYCKMFGNWHTCHTAQCVTTSKWVAGANLGHTVWEITYNFFFDKPVALPHSRGLLFALPSIRFRLRSIEITAAFPVGCELIITSASLFLLHKINKIANFHSEHIHTPTIHISIQLFVFVFVSILW